MASRTLFATSGLGLDGSFSHLTEQLRSIREGANLDTWTQSIIYPIGTTGLLGFPNETVLRDMDGDGDLDIMVMDNFLAGWFTGFPAGIYYLENKGGDISKYTELGNKNDLPGRLIRRSANHPTTAPAFLMLTATGWKTSSPQKCACATGRIHLTSIVDGMVEKK